MYTNAPYISNNSGIVTLQAASCLMVLLPIFRFSCSNRLIQTYILKATLLILCPCFYLLYCSACCIFLLLVLEALPSSWEPEGPKECHIWILEVKCRAGLESGRESGAGRRCLVASRCPMCGCIVVWGSICSLRLKTPPSSVGTLHIGSKVDLVAVDEWVIDNSITSIGRSNSYCNPFRPWWANTKNSA